MNIMTNGQGWPSEFTRGHQIADALGCRVNQPITDVDETVVYVKCWADESVRPERLTNYYMDLIDDSHMMGVFKRFPNAKVIALTDIQKNFLEDNVKNDIVVIPEHHCNFKQETRHRTLVQRVGYVGSRQCFDLDFDWMAGVLDAVGLEFRCLVCEDEGVTREDVCDFYKSIDIQIAFRGEQAAVRPPIYRNPLKIFNAGSFRVPTIAYPELSYRLCAGSYFLEASHPDSLVNKCYLLANDSNLYEFYASRAYEWSKQFDIAKIARKYAALSPKETFNIDENVAKIRLGGK